MEVAAIETVEDLRMHEVNYNHEPYVGQAYYARGTWGMNPGEQDRGYRGDTADYFQRRVLHPGFRGEAHGFPDQTEWGGHRYPGYGTHPSTYWGDRTPANRDWSANAQSAYQVEGFHPDRRQGGRSGTFGSATGGSHRGVGPRGYQRSDERIREDVQERFTDDPYLDPSDLEVEVRNGVVTLVGTVSDRQQKRRAEDLADAVSGVRDVENQLTIRRPNR